MLLAGDIGATKSRLALFSSAAEISTPLAAATFASAQYPSLEAIVREYLSGSGQSIASASFGIPGAIVNERAQITNLPWVVDARRLREELDVPHVFLFNDLEAIASAVPLLRPEDLETLNTGIRVEAGNIAIIAPGTGLGEAFITREGSAYIPHSSEGGHTDFGPVDELQLELLQYMLPRFDHVSYERICAGVGLPNLYAFWRQRCPDEEPAWLAEQLAQASDPNPVIIQAAFRADKPSTLCQKTLRTFVSILGAEAGNLAIKVLATGGVYLGGGLPPRLLPLLKEEAFMRAFTHKGRFSDLMRQMPVHVIINPAVPLLGAAYSGFNLLGRKNP